MDNVSTITSRIEDYNINEDDKQAFLEVWNKNINSDSTDDYKIRICRRQNRVCEYLQDLSLKPLREWTKDDVSAFVAWLNTSEAVTRGYLHQIRQALVVEGLSTDVLEIEDTKEANEVAGYFADFETFEAMLLKWVYEDVSETINSRATTRAVAYLVWLGLSVVEITRLKKSDYKESARCFMFEDRVFSFAAYPSMVDFFKKYNEAKKCTSKISGVLVSRTYADTPYFIKMIGKKTNPSHNVLMRRMNNELNLTFEQIHYSGIYSRLYKYEQQIGRNFNKNDVSDIQFIMRTNKDPKEFRRVFHRWMRKYNKYKELRNTNSFNQR